MANLHHLRAMTGVEVERLESLLSPQAPPGLVWYRATLRQAERQLRRVFGAVEAPIERLVAGPDRAGTDDGLRSGKVRPLKAPRSRPRGVVAVDRVAATPKRRPRRLRQHAGSPTERLAQDSDAVDGRLRGPRDPAPRHDVEPLAASSAEASAWFRSS